MGQQDVRSLSNQWRALHCWRSDTKDPDLPGEGRKTIPGEKDNYQLQSLPNDVDDVRQPNSWFCNLFEIWVLPSIWCNLMVLAILWAWLVQMQWVYTGVGTRIDSVGHFAWMCQVRRLLVGKGSYSRLMLHIGFGITIKTLVWRHHWHKRERNKEFLYDPNWFCKVEYSSYLYTGKSYKVFLNFTLLIEQW